MNRAQLHISFCSKHRAAPILIAIGRDGASSIAEQPIYLPLLNALLLFVTYCPLSGDLLCCRCLFCLLCDGGRRLSKVEDKSVIESLSCPVIFEGSLAI